MEKRKIVLSLVSAVMCFGLVACGNASSSAASSVAASSSAASSSKASSAASSSAKVSSAAVFDTSKAIKAYTRDTTSGTRDGFFTKIGLGAAKTDDSKLVSSYIEVASNAAMITSVGNDEYGIGYISLSTLADSNLKGLQYKGITPNETNVLNNSYELTRNFNYIVRNDYAADSAVGKIVTAFVAFLGTQEAKATMKAADGILSLTGKEPTWASIKANYPIASADNSAVTVRFGGSTSVEKMAKKLTAQFSPLCGHFIANHNHTGSGDAYKHTQGSGKDDSGALDIGFLSRELELTAAEPAAADTYGKMCTDAIVAVVSTKNPLTNAVADDLKGIYVGTYTKWSDLIK